jgi:hypothetical protein
MDFGSNDKHDNFKEVKDLADEQPSTSKGKTSTALKSLQVY